MNPAKANSSTHALEAIPEHLVDHLELLEEAWGMMQEAQQQFPAWAVLVFALPLEVSLVVLSLV